MLHQREARASSEGGDVAALFGDEDVAALVDTEKIRDEIARDLPELLSVGRSKDVDFALRDEERAGAEHGFESAR